MFGTYLRLGYEHLLDLQGADHILFIVVLCAAYALVRWRELLVLITAFTVGHSVSLALATVGAIQVNSAWVEFLIPVTILATAVLNVFEGAAAPARVVGGDHGGSVEPGAVKRGTEPVEGRVAHGDEAAVGRLAEGANGVHSAVGSSAVVKYLLATGFGLIHGLGFSGFLRLVLGDEGQLLVPLLAFNVGLELAQIVVALVALAAAWVLVRAGLPHRWWTRAVSVAIGAAALMMSVERWPFQ